MQLLSELIDGGGLVVFVELIQFAEDLLNVDGVLIVVGDLDNAFLEVFVDEVGNVFDLLTVGGCLLF